LSNKVIIIDYGAGNVKSLGNMLEFLGMEYEITRDKNKILSAEKIIFPGQGHFEQAMKKLNECNMPEIIKGAISNGASFLGICLGLQLLFEGSDESQGVEGLHILDGQILRIPDKEGLRIPHIGWNSLDLKNDGRLFQNMKQNPYVYFVHSYYLNAADESIVKATCDYSACIHASVEKDNVFACQFHPEKSSDVGLSILRNFTQIEGGR